MGQHEGTATRLRFLLGWRVMPWAALGAVLASASCSHLQGEQGPPSAGGSSSGGSGSGLGSSSSAGPASGSGSGSGDMTVDGAPPDAAKMSCGDSTESLPYAS